VKIIDAPAQLLCIFPHEELPRWLELSISGTLGRLREDTAKYKNTYIKNCSPNFASHYGWVRWRDDYFDAVETVVQIDQLSETTSYDLELLTHGDRSKVVGDLHIGLLYATREADEDEIKRTVDAFIKACKPPAPWNRLPDGTLCYGDGSDIPSVYDGSTWKEDVSL
jgi:hypothetical protein